MNSLEAVFLFASLLSFLARLFYIEIEIVIKRYVC